MIQHWLHGLILALLLFPSCESGFAEDAATYRSHPPMRPLPVPSKRPLGQGPTRFVDSMRGDDSQAGSETAPWKTLTHAVTKLQPGDTLYLRGGTYYEHVTVRVKGTASRPITIRSFPGELGIIDGGLREFFENPAKAWEPAPGGAKGEFRSAKAYPEIGDAGGTRVLGNFGDSMVPLQGYRFLEDLRSKNEYFAKLEGDKGTAGSGIYCGPGIYYDPQTGHIHVRLAHTRQTALGNDNYRGEQDPRKLPLVVGGSEGGSPLSIVDSCYVLVQDVVMRGSRVAAVSVSNSQNIQFEGVTAYGGSTAFGVSSTAGLRLWNCACRGIAAPWTWRGSLKYRSIEARIFSASGWSPTGQDNRDFELAYSEFTDCVDGVFLGSVRNVKFHHNLLDNVSDDGIFLTSTTGYDGKTPGGNIHIYQNLLSRCLTTFAFGVGHGRQKMTPTGRQTGAGVFVYRNVFDLRRPVMYGQAAEGDTEIRAFGRVVGDHGGPLWEPMTIYHNTFLMHGAPYRSYYAAELGGHMAPGGKRWVFNNCFVQQEGSPGALLPAIVTPQDRAALALKQKQVEDAKPTAEEAALAALLDDDEKDRKEKKKKSFAADANSEDIAKLKKTLDRKKTTLPLLIEFQADGNLHWSYDQQSPPSDLFSKYQDSAGFQSSKNFYREGSTSHDQIADPRFPRAGREDAPNLALKVESPAVDAGVSLPEVWLDPVRDTDRGQPDIGALPLGAKPWRVGFGGRLNVFGSELGHVVRVAAPTRFVLPELTVEQTSHKPAVIVQGYPARDSRLVAFFLRDQQVPNESLQATWLATDQYKNYGLVVLVASFSRARIEPNVFSSDDLRRIESFVKDGGTLLLMYKTRELFNTPQGSEFLAKWFGKSKRSPQPQAIASPSHPWVKHLDAKKPPAWIAGPNVSPLGANRAEMVLGSKSDAAMLCRRTVGKGQIIYVGWEIATSLPPGRSPSTVDQEIRYEQQMQILSNIVDSLYPKQ